MTDPRLLDMELPPVLGHSAATEATPHAIRERSTQQEKVKSGLRVEWWNPGYGRMLLIWTAISTLLYVWNYVFPPKPYVHDFIGRLRYISCYLPWAVITPLIFRIENRFPLGDRKWMKHLSCLALLSVPVSVLGASSMLFSFLIVSSILRGHIVYPRRALSLVVEFPAAEIVYWCSVATGYFLRTRFQLREQERRSVQLDLEKSRLEASLNQAQLEVLRSRLNPHFLFNSLQNISVLITENPKLANRMVVHLGDLLRAVLRNDSQPESTLIEEIELTQTYVAMEQMRFGSRLEVTFDIDARAHEAMVPSFLLQPIVENAIIHGLREIKRNGMITISGEGQGGSLVLTVTDNGVGPRDPHRMKMGVGLGSTCERLSKMYPERHSFSLCKPPEGGTEVRIAIPLHFRGELPA